MEPGTFVNCDSRYRMVRLRAAVRRASFDTPGQRVLEENLDQVPWHHVTPDEALARLGSSRAGISEEEARGRLRDLGPNALPEKGRRSLLGMLLAQFKSPLIYLLFAAAAIALALDERADAVVILCVVLVNAAIGALQEGRAERSMTALRRMAAARARVVRGEEDSRARKRCCRGPLSRGSCS